MKYEKQGRDMRDAREARASHRAKNTLPETQIAQGGNLASRVGVVIFGIAFFLVGVLIGYFAANSLDAWLQVTVAIVVGILLTTSIRMAPQWERVAVLRFGKFHHIAGPGVYFVIPIIEYAAIKVDTRMSISAFSAEETLTSDLVPVDVNAVIFWLVWDAEKACLEVQDYPSAVVLSAQTALRDAIGQCCLSDLSMRRKRIDHELEELLGRKCEAWGITITSVEIRDIVIPEDLRDALSREAQAAKERDARVLLAEVEKDISDMYVEAGEVYRNNPEAMQLRTMNLAYESTRQGKGIILAPSSLTEGFNFGKMAEQ